MHLGGFFFQSESWFSLFIHFPMLNILSIWLPYKRFSLSPISFKKLFLISLKQLCIFSQHIFTVLVVAPSSPWRLPASIVMCTFYQRWLRTQWNWSIVLSVPNTTYPCHPHSTEILWEYKDALSLMTLKTKISLSPY